MAAYEQFSLPLVDLTHRFDGIDDQVKQHLLQLDPITLDARQALCQLRAHRDAVVCGLRTGKSNNFDDSIVDLHGVLSCGRLLDKCADSPDDLACASSLLHNEREYFIHLM